MSCNQSGESLELYALGVLEIGEANSVAEHLATGCPACLASLRRALEQNAVISENVPLVDPPVRLRRRVADAIAPRSAPKRQWLPWLVAAAALVALVTGLTLQSRSRRADSEIAQAASADRARLSTMLQILGAPGTKQVSFTEARVDQLHGTVYIHQKLGLALIIDRLPKAPAGWKYESWLVPKAGVPQPVEPFYPDSQGRAVSIVPGPVEVAELSAVAVSMEPLNSRPTKPTTLVFAASI